MMRQERGAQDHQSAKDLSMLHPQLRYFDVGEELVGIHY
eukprot:CAMPEP_0170759882 /NCGR_PEP_ID=MMETSP0733-20121128/1214_1 /TAXON_ID=186038 /ORGANISM="Fragilariopsis kerguelensis, Strain L26-C5" /LENGTH=38 /DNA_ID= /DNA_START= /DNA_END= /DNA_ORIENTATION=